MGLSHSPSIIVDGLIFHIDPNNLRCYSGSGNTIYNLVNPSIGGTFVGFTANPIDNTETRSLVYNGTSTYQEFYPIEPTRLTLSVWFKATGLPSLNDAYGGTILASSPQHPISYGVLYGWATNTVHFFLTGISISANAPANKYVNAVCTYDGSNIRLYIDGILTTTTPYTTDPSYPGSGNRNLRLGFWGLAGYERYFNGNIGQASIYNRALSAAEINQNYHATKKKYLIEENIVTNGLILNLDPGNPSSYSGTGNTIYDLAGFGNTGTIVNGPAFSSLNGGSLSYDGTNDYMYVQHNNSQNLTYITVSAWFNFPVVPFSGLGINKETSFRLMSAESYTTTAGGRLGGSWGTGVGPGATTLSPNRWYQIVMTADGTTQKLYVNGSLDYTLNNSALASINSNVLSFATYHFGSSNFMNCQMSQALIYNRALSATEIQQNYNATKGRFLNALPPVRNGLVLELDAANTSSYSGFGNTWYDLTGNGYNYTLTNGPVFSSFGTTQNFFFDGSNDRALAVNPISLGTTHTVSMIIKPSSGGILFGDFAYSNTGYAFYLTGSNLYYAATDFVSTSITFTTNWIMFTVTRNGTSISFYQNGILLSSQTLGGNNPLTLRSIADFDGGGYPFAGNVSQVNCYNRALSAYEIKQNFDYYRTRYGI